MKRRLLAMLLIFAMVFSSVTPMNIVSAAETGVSYVDENGADKTCTTYTEMYSLDAAGWSTWGADETTTWLVFPKASDGPATYSPNEAFPNDFTGVTVKGNVHLILMDGYELDIFGKGVPVITVADGATLTIYGQSGGTGKLTVKGDNESNGANGNGANGEIGGEGGAGFICVGTGSIIINGGTVTATGGNGGNGGVGGYGDYFDGFDGGAGGKGGAGFVGNITVNGGTVTATGGNGGNGGAGGYGGSTGGTGGRGGAGGMGSTSSITVNGGTVTAIGGNGGTGGTGGNGGTTGSGGTGGVGGIGLSNVGIGGLITINGGTVTTTGGAGGNGGSGGTGGAGGNGISVLRSCRIMAGTVRATGGNGGTGTGGGANGANGIGFDYIAISITGGTFNYDITSLVDTTIFKVTPNDPTTPTEWTVSLNADISGSGTLADPYVLSTEEELRAFATVAASYDFAGKFVKLGSDIALTSAWTPINPSFAGCFDGDGHIVKNVDISVSESGHDAGFFEGITASAVVKNLNIEGSVSNSAYNRAAGGIVGYNLGKVCNCSMNGSVTTDGTLSYAGGIVGYNGGDVTNCFSLGNIKSEYSAGGIVGGIDNNAINTSINSCFSAAEIEGDPSASGGILGGLLDGNISYCYYLDSIATCGSMNPTANPNTYALCKAQMTAGAVTNNADETWKLIYGSQQDKYSLLLALNYYVAQCGDADLDTWKRSESGYPTFDKVAVPDYLTFTAEEDGSEMSFKWVDSDKNTGVMYKASSDSVLVGDEAAETEWTAYTAGTKITLTNKNDSVQFKGTGVTTNTSNNFTITGGKIAASGSVTSLTDGYGVDPNVTLTENCYSGMFFKCTALTTAPKLPAKTLTYKCYMAMFFGCTSLTEAPELSATKLAGCCYMEMFRQCTGFTEAPELPAETLTVSCYKYMFEGCTALTAAPTLPATELAEGCYQAMFSGCTSLTSVPVLNATTLEADCYDAMFYGCTKLLVSAATESDYTWKIPNTTATDSVTNMAANTAADSVTVATAANPGEYNYYKVEEAPDYLTFTAEEDGAEMSFKWALGSDVMYRASSTYVLVGENPASTTWTTYTAGTKITLTNKDDFVQFKGKDVGTDTSNHFTITNGKIAASGSVTSLTDGYGADPDVTLTDYCYVEMFSGCTSLTEAPALPATDLVERCYAMMFYDCTALTEAPALPAKTLTDYCYSSMFMGCTSLTKAPALPATQLAECCYGNMFNGCTSLTEAPALPAEALKIDCYSSMFYGCTSLTKAPALPSTDLADNCYLSMFSGCTSLTEAPELPATELAMGCYAEMFMGCTRLLVSEATSSDYTWKIPYAAAGTAEDAVLRMAADTAADSVTVETAASDGEYNYYKVTYVAPDYLTFTAEEAGAVMSFKWVDSDTNTSVMYRASSTNVLVGDEAAKTEWTAYTAGDIITLTNKNDSVQFKGTDVTTDYSNHFTITNGKISASGSVTSLTDGYGANPKITLTKSCYYDMFRNCTALTAAPELPATTLAYLCYSYMFMECTALTKAPELPATELAGGCYEMMFYGCTALTEAPDLPATTLQNRCYAEMFSGCTSLTAAPEIKATTLQNGCCHEMFSGCTSLTAAPELLATTLASGCYKGMFKECTSLTAAPELKATELVEDCYIGMFYGCTSLMTAPKLSAEALEGGCYRLMFYGCTKLLVSECEETDEYTWKIPYAAAGTAEDAVTDMAADTMADSVTVETAANSGEFKYYKVIGVGYLCKETKTSNVKEGIDLTLVLGGKEAGTFEIVKSGNGYKLYDTVNKQYVGFDTNTKKVNATEFVWSYDGGLYASVTTTTTKRILFWNRTSKSTTKYYLTYTGSAFDVKTSSVKAQVIETVSYETHDTAYRDNGDGTHTQYCKRCGAELGEAEKHTFEGGKCEFCGALDPESTGVTDVEVAEKAVTSSSGWLFWKKTTTKYQYTITPVKQGVNVSKVTYSYDGETWKTGTKFTSASKLDTFYICVKDSNGTETSWVYRDNDVFPNTPK